MEGDGGQRERRWPCEDFLMGVDELQEEDSDDDDVDDDEEEEDDEDDDDVEYTDKWTLEEPTVKRERQLSGSGPYRVESRGFLPAYPINAPQDAWNESGGKEVSGSSVPYCWVYLDEKYNVSDCAISSHDGATAGPGSHRPHPITSKRSVTSPVSYTDDATSLAGLDSPNALSIDPVPEGPGGPGCSNLDPVNAAAHLHLLGESLTLIGQQLRETNKMLCVNGSLSLLLDSALCALAPLMCLTSQIPELRSCPQHTLVDTMENISYMMPGL